MKEAIEHIGKTTVRANGERSQSEDTVLKEHVLSVIVNENPVFRLVCTKTDLKELVLGRLFTEGLIESPEEITKLYFCPSENEARIFLDHEVKWEEWQGAEPSCCTANRIFLTASGRRELTPLPKHDWKAEWIFDLSRRFLSGVEIHRTTQGTHSCFLSKDGDILFSSEDIGRHNAIDKAIGFALLNDIPLSECLLYTSGRVPVDMVQKVISAGIPVLVSKAVPTAESVELAQQYGLTLICRAYPDQFEIYANE